VVQSREELSLTIQVIFDEIPNETLIAVSLEEKKN
jgi:hypothetical protein